MVPGRAPDTGRHIHCMCSIGLTPQSVNQLERLQGTGTVEAVKEYITDVKARTFPAPEHTFKIDDAVLEKLY